MTSFVSIIGLIILCAHNCFCIQQSPLRAPVPFDPESSKEAEKFIKKKCADDERHFSNSNTDATTHLAEGSNYEYCSGGCTLNDHIPLQAASSSKTEKNAAKCAKANPENQRIIKSIFSNIMDLECIYLNHEAYQIDYKCITKLVLTCPYLEKVKTEYATEMDIRLEFDNYGALKRQIVCSSSPLIQAVRNFKKIYDKGCINGSYTMLFELNWNRTTIIAAVIVGVLFIAFTLGVACCIKKVMGCCMHKMYIYKRVEFDANGGVTDTDEEEELVK